MHETTHIRRNLEINFQDESSKRTILEITPASFGRQVKNLLVGEYAYLLGMTERRLVSEMIRKGQSPDATDALIRMQFWTEYNRATDVMITRVPKMNFSYVIGKAIPKESFYKYYITDPYKLAYLLCPPMDYVAIIRSTLINSIYALDELLQKGVQTDPVGFAPLALKIFEAIEKRAKAAGIDFLQNEVKAPKTHSSKKIETLIPPTREEKTIEELAAEVAEKEKLLVNTPPPPNLEGEF